jgi:hypothetical protein
MDALWCAIVVALVFVLLWLFMSTYCNFSNRYDNGNGPTAGPGADYSAVAADGMYAN